MKEAIERMTKVADEIQAAAESPMWVTVSLEIFRASIKSTDATFRVYSQNGRGEGPTLEDAYGCYIADVSPENLLIKAAQLRDEANRIEALAGGAK